MDEIGRAGDGSYAILIGGKSMDRDTEAGKSMAF